MRSGSMIVAVPIVLAGWLVAAGNADDGDTAEVLAMVNRVPITRAELELEYLSRQIPAESRDQHRDRVLSELVERKLIAEFLAQRKIEVPERDLENQLATLRRVVAATERDFDAAIAQLGFSEESLRQHLSLPLAWNVYVRKTVTDEQLRQEFQQHRERYDGARVRASQIVISVPRDAPPERWTEAETTLATVRQEIVDGKLSFADAARQHSTSPSGRQGGDLGFFEYRGRLPIDISSCAFETEPNELSPVFRTSFGVHLVTTTERRPGDLSLEDVRGKVFEELSRSLWQTQVETERQQARIEWKVDPPPSDRE